MCASDLEKNWKSNKYATQQPITSNLALNASSIAVDSWMPPRSLSIPECLLGRCQFLNASSVVVNLWRVEAQQLTTTEEAVTDRKQSRRHSGITNKQGGSHKFPNASSIVVNSWMPPRLLPIPKCHPDGQSASQSLSIVEANNSRFSIANIFLSMEVYFLVYPECHHLSPLSCVCAFSVDICLHCNCVRASTLSLCHHSYVPLQSHVPKYTVLACLLSHEKHLLLHAFVCVCVCLCV
jgi:hypothetical protein